MTYLALVNYAYYVSVFAWQFVVGLITTQLVSATISVAPFGVSIK